MSTADNCIADLDAALADVGEPIKLRCNGDVADEVTCQAKVTAISREEIAAGIAETMLNVIMSPSEINAAQWPRTSRGQLKPPFDEDPRIPRVGKDEAIVRGRARTVDFVDPLFVGGTLVRINMRVAG